MEILIVAYAIQEKLFLEFQIIKFETYFNAANFQNVTSITWAFNWNFQNSWISEFSK